MSVPLDLFGKCFRKDEPINNDGLMWADLCNEDNSLDKKQRYFVDELKRKGFEVRFDEKHIYCNGESDVVFSHLKANLRYTVDEL